LLNTGDGLQTLTLPAAAPLKLSLPAPQHLVPADNATVSKASLVVYNGLRFSWDPVTGAESYTWTLLGPGQRVLMRHTLTETSFFLTDLMLLARYQYFVWTVQAEAKNSVDNALASASFHANIPLPPAPLAGPPEKLGS
jgi:hypothetical protein